jgi:hypothetical protein
MKKICLPILILVFLLFCENVLKAQVSETKLNQVELMKQFLGTWQGETSKDTIFSYDAKPMGSGLDINYKIVTKGKVLQEGRILMGYYKNLDKYVLAKISKQSSMVLNAYWFTTDKTWNSMKYDDLSNPDRASWKNTGEFKTPDLYLETHTINNKPNVIAWTRVK